jgi:hypothetical protein
MSGMTERVSGLGPREAAANDAHQMMRRVLLAAGVLSSLLYIVATDIVAASPGGFADAEDDRSLGA